MSMPEANALLQQIAALMEQYLALGEETPLKATFEQIMPEVQAGAGGGEYGGGAPVEGGGPLENEDIVEPESVEGEMSIGGPMPSEGPPPDWPSARAGAMQTLTGAKTEDEEQRRRRKQ